MSNRFLLVILACIVVFAGLLFFTKDSADAPVDESVTTTNHVLGNEDAAVTLTEYGDFQCPACGGYYSILKEVKDKYGDQLNFQFRHFPLIAIHPNAMAAHRAAEAAGKQGKFFDMHDLLYERQAEWSNSTSVSGVFERYAEELELDMDQYRQDVASAETNAIIQADLAAGKDMNVSSTPSFLINGEFVQNNPRDVEGFSELIDAALAETEGNAEDSQE